VAEVPQTRYALLDGDGIAYQVHGEGPVDVLLAPTSGECVDMRWEWPPYAEFLWQLGSFGRVIGFDRLGTGSSDSIVGDALPSWERWADEAQAVLDAVGSEMAVIFGWADSSPTAVLFSAVHGDRTRGLILFNSAARFAADADYAFGGSPEVVQRIEEIFVKGWGTDEITRPGNPDAWRDPAFRHWAARSTRLTMSPKDAGVYFRWLMSADVREVLRSVRAPTLVMHREQLKILTPEQGRHVAQQIPNARYIEVPGRDTAPYAAPTEDILVQIGEFLGGLRAALEPDRALAAILFTDIVGSTERVAALGDREWRNLLETHDVLARTIVDQHRGRLIKTTGDGMLATFDGPGRAIRCASALRDAFRPLGLEIRAGLHTGEVELTGDDIAGIGVHIAARVLDCASGGELLTSAAVPMLVAGSGIEFEDRGERELKGIPGTWRLFCVVG
jgi:class 3 adenylate cyclase